MIVLLFLVAVAEFCAAMLFLALGGTMLHAIAAILLVGFAFLNIGLAALIAATRELYPAIQLQGRLSSEHPLPKRKWSD